MEKELDGKLCLDTTIGFEGVNSACGFNSGMFFDKSKGLKHLPTLAASLNYIEKINPYAGYNFGILQIEESLRNESLRNLIFELARAIDANSEMEVKRLKVKYGDTKDFAQAKMFLDRKCKEIWNVFDHKNDELKLPKRAMKVLGISNQPSLDFLFEDSLKYFEKENSTTTVDIIKSVLNNKNMDYSFEDILKYLKTMHKKRIFDYNLHTVRFLARRLNFDKNKLNYLGIKAEQIGSIFKTLSISEKLKCGLNYYLKFSKKRLISIKINLNY